MCLVRGGNGDSVVAVAGTCQGDQVRNRQVGLLDDQKEELVRKAIELASGLGGSGLHCFVGAGRRFEDSGADLRKGLLMLMGKSCRLLTSG